MSLQASPRRVTVQESVIGFKTRLRLLRALASVWSQCLYTVFILSPKASERPGQDDKGDTGAGSIRNRSTSVPVRCQCVCVKTIPDVERPRNSKAVDAFLVAKKKDRLSAVLVR